jgi:hypothetical protein
VRGTALRRRAGAGSIASSRTRGTGLRLGVSWIGDSRTRSECPRLRVTGRRSRTRRRSVLGGRAQEAGSARSRAHILGEAKGAADTIQDRRLETRLAGPRRAFSDSCFRTRSRSPLPALPGHAPRPRAPTFPGAHYRSATGCRASRTVGASRMGRDGAGPRGIWRGSRTASDSASRTAGADERRRFGGLDVCLRRVGGRATRTSRSEL